MQQLLNIYVFLAVLLAGLIGTFLSDQRDRENPFPYWGYAVVLVFSFFWLPILVVLVLMFLAIQIGDRYFIEK